jgi:S-adenosylmethionine hydrolase
MRGRTYVAALGVALMAAVVAGCSQAPEARTTGSLPTIALMTDFGESDFYVGAVKGVIRTIAPTVTIDDLAHQLEAYGVRGAAWNLYLAAREYPPRTIVVAVVDPGVGTARRPIALRTKDVRLFVGPDNCLFTFIVERLGPVEVRHVTNSALFRPGTISHSFHTRDIFAPVAAHLATGTPFAAVGPTITDYVVLPIQPANLGKEEVTGAVITIDHYGNLHTNVPGEMLVALSLARGDLADVTIGEVTKSVRLVSTYGDVPEGEPLIFVASTEHLEVAVNRGSAQEVFGAKPNSLIRITPHRAHE